MTGEGSAGRYVPAASGPSDLAGEEYEYVVVGSGAGGGPVAANLAEAGHRVLLIEAGDAAGGLTYEVPAYHAAAAEDPSMRWDYTVRHWDDEVQQRRDSKYQPDRGGVWYPRTGTLGGCTAHNAMITVYPHAADWDGIAAATGDASWASTVMRQYFQQLERCTYLRRPWLLPRSPRLAAILERLSWVPARLVNSCRHGFDGWLSTTLADPTLVLRDGQLLKVILSAAEQELAASLGRPLTPLERLESYVDPNDWRVAGGTPQGLWQVPLSIEGGHRVGARTRVQAVQAAHPDQLRLLTGALVTRVLLDENAVATGVEYLPQRHAYRADPHATTAPPPALRRVTATREVILCGGAFNTPQLLMLSGIGPRAELERHEVEVHVDLPGVGANLQDRYEVGVVFEAEQDFTVVGECSFLPPRDGEQPDPCLVQWRDGHPGIYGTNGSILAVTARSRPDLANPDLFLFGLPAAFRGYYPGYSRDLERRRNVFTWAVLKGHTNNRAGRVTLASRDPRDPPDVRFRYFEEGSDAHRHDLDGVVHGIELARRLMRRAHPVIRRELVPGPAVESPEDLRRFVRDEAWGHHACGTAQIGADTNPMAVLDSKFRVRGTDRLRVVDASVFPRIPGFFIVTPIYMVAEKASADILAAAGTSGRPRRTASGRTGGAGSRR